MHEKYAVVQDLELIKESSIPGREKDVRCKCGGKIDKSSNILICSKNGSKCLEK